MRAAVTTLSPFIARDIRLRLLELEKKAEEAADWALRATVDAAPSVKWAHVLSCKLHVHGGGSVVRSLRRLASLATDDQEKGELTTHAERLEKELVERGKEQKANVEKGKELAQRLASQREAPLLLFLLSDPGARALCLSEPLTVTHPLDHTCRRR